MQENAGVADDPGDGTGRGSTAADGAATFGGRVAGVLGTRLVQLASTVLVSFLLASLLGPSDRGVYALVILLPTTLFAVAQLGLPSALTYYAGRGGSLPDLQRHAVRLGLLVSAISIGATLLLLPVLSISVLRAAPFDLVVIALAAVPLRIVATLAGAALYGRHRFRTYNLILAAQSILDVVLVLLLVGYLGLAVPGAVAAYLAFIAAGAVAVLVHLRRVTAAEPGGDPVATREVLGYGTRLYPATLGTFFGYRADVFLLGWLLGSSREIGIYSVAVSLAELVFNVPDSVGTVLFPRIASVSEEEAHRLAPAMVRMTVLVTAGAGVSLVPVAWVVLTLVLPAYSSGLLPLLVILPGIVSLSVAKVLTSYLSGIHRLGALTAAAIVSLVVNIAANLVLIPLAGITGAAASSLISYTSYAALMVVFASRASATPWVAFVVPKRDDAARVRAALGRLVTSIRPRSAT